VPSIAVVFASGSRIETMGAETLRLTYLGWQGWCVESPAARLLIDPLLVDEVGRGPKCARVNFMFAIPRRFDLAALGPVDAVYLSHEHEDHFNVPTLVRLDRRIPLIVSGLMSEAGRAFLVEMGFRMDCVWSGDTRAVGDLEIEFFGPNHAGTAGLSDEWDTTAYLVRQSRGRGVFASNVDIPLGPRLRQALDGAQSQGAEPVIFSGMMVRGWPERAAADAKDENHHRASKPPSRNAEADAAAFRGGEAFTPYPGEVMVLGDGALQEVEPHAAFLRCPSGYARTLPFFNPDAELKDPVVGNKNFDVSQKASLEEELARLAEHLYGGPLFRLLMSIGNDAQADRRTIALVFVIDEEGREWTYEYRPLACAFVQVDKTSEQVGEYLGAMLLWATDFLAVATGQIEPRVLTRCVVEERAHDLVPRLVDQLWYFYHPLRFPGRVLAQYRRALALENGASTCVFPRMSVLSTP
jgi:hypothetical protein